MASWPLTAEFTRRFWSCHLSWHTWGILQCTLRSQTHLTLLHLSTHAASDTYQWGLRVKNRPQSMCGLIWGLISLGSRFAKVSLLVASWMYVLKLMSGGFLDIWHMKKQPLLRDWAKTRSLTKRLWSISWKKGYITIFTDFSQGWGVCNSLNLPFVKKMQALSSNVNVRQQSIFEVGRSLDLKHQDHMFNPFLRLSCKLFTIGLSDVCVGVR